MTGDQFDDFFEDAMATWSVATERIPKLREAWESRFLGADAQTFNFTLRRAEEIHTRFLPTIPQILALYREIDRQATEREKSNRLLSERRSAESETLTSSECIDHADYFARRAVEIRTQESHRPNATGWAAWFESLAAYYRRQADRVRSGAPMERRPLIDEILGLMGAKADRDVERARAAHTRRVEDECGAW